MNYNFLIVDDSETIRAVIKRTLHVTQVPVGKLYEAANGIEALDILHSNWIDLVFADINMPEMNGVEMIEHMSKDGILQTVPVIIVSTEGSQTRIESLRLKGVRGYIRKPFTPEIIRKVVCDVLGE